MIAQRLLTRLVVFAVALVVASLGYLLVIEPLSNWRNTTISTRNAIKDEMTRLNDSIARLQAEKQSFITDDLSALTWEGAQAAEATARIQSALNDMARETGILMRSIAPTNETSSDFPSAATFRLEFEASLDQLVPFLKAVEYGQPVLVVTRANFRRLVRTGQTGPQPDLFMQIDIAAPVRLPAGARG